jgi:CelD/BcsL family acetyltransferase involved in cellulose biosynthesis
MEQKGRALARKGVADIFAPPGHREFFLDLASDPKTSHLVHISRIEIGDVCAAANFGIVFGDRYYHVLASYVDSEVAHYGPGALHLRELLAYAIKHGLKCFDFTIGDEQYKLDWCDTVLKLYDYGDDEVARPAGARRLERATAKQAPDQAVAAVVESRLARAQRRWGVLRRVAARNRCGRDGEDAACADSACLCDGRHGPAAAARAHKNSVRGGEPPGRAFALFALRALAPRLGRL